MSKMAELDWEIELRVCEGMKSDDIAKELDIPLSLVESWHRAVGLEWEAVFPDTWPFGDELSPYATSNS